jgi:hypothetical protein
MKKNQKSSKVHEALIWQGFGNQSIEVVGHVSELRILATCFASGVELLVYLWIISL